MYSDCGGMLALTGSGVSDGEHALRKRGRVIAATSSMFAVGEQVNEA